MDTTIPQITITSPTGDQVPVQLFPLPAPKGARVKVWEFFETEPETETNAAPSFDGGVEWDPNAPESESEPENGNNEKDEDEDEPPKKKRRV
ncbi:hypothetical protein FPSE5266_07514 [Fusarium pseudograminearum]|nr:hypothetical protein FPSE5266_07514 [Fusarium pseudograminearum]